MRFISEGHDRGVYAVFRLHCYTGISTFWLGLALTEIDRSRKFPLRPIPELRPNQISKHMPVSEASVKAGAPGSCRCFGKKSRSFGKKSRSFGFLAEAPALPILPILENLAEAASADASAD